MTRFAIGYLIGLASLAGAIVGASFLSNIRELQSELNMRQIAHSKRERHNV